MRITRLVIVNNWPWSWWFCRFRVLKIVLNGLCFISLKNNGLWCQALGELINMALDNVATSYVNLISHWALFLHNSTRNPFVSVTKITNHDF